MESSIGVKARRGSRQPSSLFFAFEVRATRQTVNDRGRPVSQVSDVPLRDVRCCIAEMSAEDIEVFRQKKLDVSHVLVSRGRPRAERLNVLCMKCNPKRCFEVESVDDPGNMGEYTLYYCKER